MSSHPGSAFQDEPSESDSRNCENIIIDGPGDSTVRPATPPLLDFLIAQRDRLLRRWQELNEQSQNSEEDKKP